MAQLHPLVAVGALFALSLFGAFVLFRILKSSALIRKPGYQAGGALAGFLFLYAALFHSLVRMTEASAPRPWTVVGVVEKEDVAKHDGVKVTQVPPMPSAFTDIAGAFRLENVVLRVDEAWPPECQFEVEGYYPSPCDIDESTAEIDSTSRTITLKKVRLLKVKEEEDK